MTALATKRQALTHYTEQARMATLEQQRDELTMALSVIRNNLGLTREECRDIAEAALTFKARAVLARIKA